ncbi:MAG: hypothetical protein IJ685_14200 [Selenomonadaceae bacterium]|nr:hypothetical protein [Selenomonadaceae bacterium]
MKILMVFVDMLRAVNQNLCNKSVPWNKLDEALAKFGGTVYSKCYSPAPDTPRGLASIWTGTYPKMNGCNSRIKYPRYFLNDNLDNIWKLFERNHMSLNLFVEKYCLEAGELPFSCEERNDIAIFDDNDLNRFVRSVKIRDNSVTFITLNEYHHGIDALHCLEDLEHVYKTVGNKIDLIFDSLGRDTFDIVVIFSDHGCLLKGDSLIYHNGRIQTYLQLWVKNAGMDTLTVDNRMCSCMDIFPTMAFLMDDFVLNRVDGLNLFMNIGHPFLVIEDYFDFSATLSQVLGWYGIIFPNLFFRTDCSGKWYSEGGEFDLEPDLKKTFETILCNYATDYDENTRLQQRIDALNG